jgi:hypothetical protein
MLQPMWPETIVGHAAMLTAVTPATAMLRPMWVFPLAAAVIAVLFAAALVRRYAGSRRWYELVWALALLMYAGASLAVAFGVANGWTSGEFRVYWALGAVLNVPFLAAGELDLLFHVRSVRWTLYVLLAFITAYTVAVVRTAEIHTAALAQEVRLIAAHELLVRLGNLTLRLEMHAHAAQFEAPSTKQAKALVEQWGQKTPTVVVALHDLSLAARFCHRIVLMQAGRTIAAGAPEDVLQSEHLAAVYGINAHYATIEGVPVVLVTDVLP